VIWVKKSVVLFLLHGITGLVRREQASPVSRLKEQAVMMKDRNEIKKSLTELAHQRQDRRNQSTPIQRMWTVSVRPFNRSNSTRRESAGRDNPSGRLIGIIETLRV